MTRRYFIRRQAELPLVLEDYETWITIGLGTTMFNTRTSEWFYLSDRPADPGSLARRNCGIVEITAGAWLKQVGFWTGWSWIVADWLCHIWPFSRIIARRRRRRGRAWIPPVDSPPLDAPKPLGEIDIEDDGELVREYAEAERRRTIRGDYGAGNLPWVPAQSGGDGAEGDGPG